MIVSEVAENSEDPIFGNTASRGSIGSIKSVCGSSLKITLEICKQNFLKYIPFHFWPPKSDLTATTWQPAYFLKNNRVERRHELYQIGLTKVLERRLQKKIHILGGTFRQNPPNIAILPVKSPFQEPLGSYFVRFFEPKVPALRLSRFWNHIEALKKLNQKHVSCISKIFSLHFLPRTPQSTREHSLTWFLFCPWLGASKSARRNFLYGVWWKKNFQIDKYVVCTDVFGTHVVCASARVWSLPGDLLPNRRRSIVFRV